jgi:hypothetical protein
MVRTMEYDDGPLTEQERLAAIRRAGTLAGWNDPKLDFYEEYRRKDEYNVAGPSALQLNKEETEETEKTRVNLNLESEI